MNVDQLRLNIEQLPPAAQDLAYYEKWSVSMLNHLRRSGTIDPASYRRFIDLSASSPSEDREPRFARETRSSLENRDANTIHCGFH